MEIANSLVLLIIYTFAKTAKCLDKSRQGPVFIYEPPMKLIFLNSTGAQLSCSAHGIPDPEIKWLRSDGGIVSDVPGLLSVLQNDTIVFERFRSEEYRQAIHASAYRCSASNIHGRILSRYAYVRAAVKQPYEVQVYDEYVIKGNTAVMKCHVPSFVKDFVKITAWIRSDNYQILPSNPPTGRYSVFDDGCLHIRNVNHMDNNMAYKCKTRHSLSGDIQISVSHGLLKVSEPKNSVAPRLTHSILEVEVKNGDNVELPCSAQAWPAPTYKWFRQKKNHSEEIFGDSRKFMKMGGSLCINHVVRDDLGTYTCQVSNNVGSTSSTTNVFLKGELSVYVQPQYLEVDSGKSANLTCLVTSSRPYKVSWLKDGRIISRLDSTSIGFEEHQQAYSLFKSSIQRTDEGMYQCHVTCEAKGVQGTAEIVLGSDSPVISEIFQYQLKRQSTRLMISCTATGNPTPMISWERDQLPLRQSSHISIRNRKTKMAETRSTLTIENLQVYDGGRYSCLAQNRAGNERHGAKVDVYGPPNIRPIANITVVAESDVRLDCFAVGYPIKDIVWFRESGLLNLDSRATDLKNGTLIIRQTTPIIDSGQYTCKAFGEGTQPAQKSAWITIIVKPLIQPITRQIVKEGRKVSLTCSIVEGDGPVEIQWFKDGEHLPHSLGIKIVRVEDMSILRIPSVHSVHNGDYTCLAENMAGNYSETAEIRVKVPPIWILKPMNQSVSLFRDAVFDCLAEGFPTPATEWFKKSDKTETLVEENANFKIMANGSLLLKNITRYMSGVYLCRSSNGVGSSLSALANLRISFRPHVAITKLSVTDAVSEDIRMKCIGGGDGPMVVQWKHDGEIIHQNKRHLIKKYSGRKSLESNIVIKSAVPEDNGIYECIITNNHGSNRDNVTVQIQEPPGPPLEFSVETHEAGLLLKWKEPSKGKNTITSYIIQKQTIRGTWKNVTVRGTANMYILQELERPYRHKIRMAAQNGVGIGPPTPELVVQVFQNGSIRIEETHLVPLNWCSESPVLCIIISTSALCIFIIIISIIIIIKRRNQHRDRKDAADSDKQNEVETIENSGMDDKSTYSDSYYNTSTLMRRGHDLLSQAPDNDESCSKNGYYSTVSPYAMFKLQENGGHQRVIGDVTSSYQRPQSFFQPYTT